MESANEKVLKKSLGETPYKLMKGVILGKLTEHSVKAMKDAIESSAFPQMADGAETSLKEAQRYQTALEVLLEIEKMPTYDLVSTKVV